MLRYIWTVCLFMEQVNGSTESSFLFFWSDREEKGSFVCETKGVLMQEFPAMRHWARRILDGFFSPLGGPRNFG